MRSVVLIGTKRRTGHPEEGQSELGELISATNGWVIRLARGEPRAAVREARRGLQAGRPMTIGLLNKIPEPRDFWVVMEWIGRLVADPALLAELGEEVEQWRFDQELEGHGLIVLHPLPTPTSAVMRRVEGPDQYRESIRSSHPTVCH